MGFAMRRGAAVLALFILAPLAAQAGEQSFTQTIKLKEKLDLAIVAGAGTVRISQGPEGRLTITGHVRANDWRPSDDRLRDIAANPPIEREGNTVRIGSAPPMAHAIIDYEIEAPADSVIEASAGIGDIADDGAGTSLHLSTGSGSIHASGITGSIDASSKEGDIDLESDGTGEVKAETGTGNVALRNVHGALRATSGEGNIQVAGVPAGDWTVETGKGNIEVALNQAACTIDARAREGLVESDVRVEGADKRDLQHVAGTIHGGGHSVTVRTGEGEIRIR